MSVCNVWFNNPQKSWTLTWIGTRPSWKLGQENWQSIAADFKWTVYSWIDSVGDCVIFAKCIQWMVELDLLMTADSMILRSLLSGNWNTSVTVLISVFWTESS